MDKKDLTLRLLAGQYAVCQLDAAAAIPAWAGGAFVAITRTTDELSVVCDQSLVPNGIRAERDWCCLKIVGQLDFGLTGIVAGITHTLAAVGISVFVISTYNTDYVLVRHASLERAMHALSIEGYSIQR
ncbi:MAG: ACT domain-containing protein [Anaerolineae bacterium]